MKRTVESVFLSKQKEPIPKSIRTKTLRNFLIVINLMLFSNQDISRDDLYDEPKKCIEYIMKIVHVNRRAAYDYYTTLLHIDNNYEQSVQMALQKFGFT